MRNFKTYASGCDLGNLISALFRSDQQIKHDSRLMWVCGQPIRTGKASPEMIKPSAQMRQPIAAQF